MEILIDRILTKTEATEVDKKLIISLYSLSLPEGEKAGMYIIEFPPPPPCGEEVKGFGDGEDNQRGKKEKKKI